MINRSILQIFIGVLVVVVVTFVADAFTEPTQVPPGGNVSAPLNTSATTQTKTGKLLFPWSEDSDQPGYYVDPGANSWLYRLYSYDVRSDIFYDRNNTNYFLEPEGVSRLSGIDADSVVNRSGVSVYKCPNKTQESTCGGQGGWNGCHGQITTDTFCYFKVGTTDANGFPYCYFEAAPCSYVGKLTQ